MEHVAGEGSGLIGPWKQTLYYATNRRHVGRDRWSPGRYGVEYSRDGVENLRFGKVELSLDPEEADKRPE